AAVGLDGVTLVDKAASVSALLGWYRAMALPGILAAAAAMLLVLFVRYGVSAPRLMLPVLLGEAFSLAIFGYSCEPLTIFAIGGWLLTLGSGASCGVVRRRGIRRRGP